MIKAENKAETATIETVNIAETNMSEALMGANMSETVGANTSERVNTELADLFKKVNKIDIVFETKSSDNDNNNTELNGHIQFIDRSLMPNKQMSAKTADESRFCILILSATDTEKCALVRRLCRETKLKSFFGEYIQLFGVSIPSQYSSTHVLQYSEEIKEEKKEDLSMYTISPQSVMVPLPKHLVLHQNRDLNNIVELVKNNLVGANIRGGSHRVARRNGWALAIDNGEISTYIENNLYNPHLWKIMSLVYYKLGIKKPIDKAIILILSLDRCTKPFQAQFKLSNHDLGLVMDHEFDTLRQRGFDISKNAPFCRIATEIKVINGKMGTFCSDLSHSVSNWEHGHDPNQNFHPKYAMHNYLSLLTGIGSPRAIRQKDVALYDNLWNSKFLYKTENAMISIDWTHSLIFHFWQSVNENQLRQRIKNYDTRDIPSDMKRQLSIDAANEELKLNGYLFALMRPMDHLWELQIKEISVAGAKHAYSAVWNMRVGPQQAPFMHACHTMYRGAIEDGYMSPQFDFHYVYSHKEWKDVHRNQQSNNWRQKHHMKVATKTDFGANAELKQQSAHYIYGPIEHKKM